MHYNEKNLEIMEKDAGGKWETTSRLGVALE